MMKRIPLALLAIAAWAGQQAAVTAIVTDTGSTNTPGMTVSVPAKGRAVVEHRSGHKARLSLSADLNIRLLKDLERRIR